MKKHGVVMVLVFAFIVLTIVFAGAGPTQAENQTGFEEAYGAAVGAGLYNIQVILGITADAFAGKVYNKDDAKDIITEQKNVLGLLDDYAGKLLKQASTSKDDLNSLNDISVCIVKLKATADALLGYLANPANDAASDFQTKRKASYAAIEKLLGLDKHKK